MAKTEGGQKTQSQKQGDKAKTKGDEGKKKGGKKGGKKGKETELKPGMSYLYDPCPHIVWTPKPGERDKSEPRGVGAPWYEPVRKKEDVDKEEAEKSKKKEEKAQQKRDEARKEKEKQKEEEEKKKKEKQKRKEEKQKKREEEKKKKEKEKKKQEDEKRKQQKEKREKEKSDKKKQEEESKDKTKKKEKPPPASYFYDPCPHRVYTPGPGEKDIADPKGVGSPWYVPVRKKEDIDKEEEEQREQDNQKRKEERKKRQKEKKEQEKREEEANKEEEDRMRRKEKRNKERIERRRREIERRRQEKEREDLEHEEVGCGIRESKTDFTPELILMMDFMSNVDEMERERHGEALRWKKEEIEQELESYQAKEAFTSDFKNFISTFIEAEWARADKKCRRIAKEEKRRRVKIFKDMDPLSKDLLAEGKRYKTLYKAAMMEKDRGSGDEGPTAMEDMVIGAIMKQMEKLNHPGNAVFNAGMF